MVEAANGLRLPWVGREISAKDGSESSSEFTQDEHFNPLPSFWSDQFSISILSYGDRE